MRILNCLLLIAATAATSSAHDQPLLSPFVEFPPVIDGDLSDWNEASFVTVDPLSGVVETGSNLDDAADLSFAFGVANDDRYLYVAVRVTDDILVLDSNRDPTDVAAQPWTDDAVEIFIDGDHSHSPDARDAAGVEFATGGEFAITANGAVTSDQSGFPRSGGDPAFWISATSYTPPPGAAYQAPWDHEVGGFVVEARFDFAVMGGTVRAGDTIGFTVSAHDDDDGDNREAALYWEAVPHDPWKDEGGWGDLVLSVAPGTQPEGPHALRSDIGIRQIVGGLRSVVRIAKDPRDNTLYTMTSSGDISRIDIDGGGGGSVAPLYSAVDHGVSSTLGFTIGPDGSFYLTFNRRGERSTVPDRVVLGILDSATGERLWTVFSPPSALPADAPVEEILDAGQREIRVARDPENTLHILRPTGEITRGRTEVVYTSADHGVSEGSIGGFFIGADGTFYITAKPTLDLSKSNIAGIIKGTEDSSTGERRWSLLAETEPYPRSGTGFDHLVNGIVVDPDNLWVYFNSGSRTDHGEIQDNRGTFPETREVPLTSVILRVPVDGEGILLPDDEDALRSAGYLFADGVRNTFDLRFAPNGDLFGAENGPDRDHSDELNWLREGHHFGFPWRMGNTDNPQQFAGYVPVEDSAFIPAGGAAFDVYRNDPGYPSPPLPFTPPVVNLGPDADRFRDPLSGQVRDASDLGLTVSTFTAHRSPLGLVFDEGGGLIPEFRGDGFLLSIGGDCCDLIDPFDDPDEDLIHLDLVKKGDHYETRATRIVAGFRGPIDAEIVGNRIYVVEYSGNRGLWEIALPTAPTTAVEEPAAAPGAFELSQNYPNPFNSGTIHRFSTSADGRAQLTVFDLLGQPVAHLVDGFLPAGAHVLRWDGTDDGGHELASGTYVYRLRVGERTASRKLLLLR